MKEYKEYIAVRSICSLYKVSENILLNMVEHDLIKVVITDDVPHLALDEVEKLERYLRLYIDLGINVEGLAVIMDLIEERDRLRRELAMLKK